MEVEIGEWVESVRRCLEAKTKAEIINELSRATERQGQAKGSGLW